MRIRNAILAVTAGSGLALALMTGAASAQPANTLDFWGNVCHSSSCLNDTLGFENFGNPIQFWHYGGAGEPNNDWNVWGVGTVDCGDNQFPFYTTNSAVLSLCSEFYSGDPVLKFAFAPGGSGNGSGLCISFVPDTPLAKLQTCAKAFGAQLQDTFQYFIYNPNDYLVNVGATLESFSGPTTHQTFWLGYCTSTADGNPTCISPSNRLQWNLVTPP